jgi:hypothetical protein
MRSRLPFEVYVLGQLGAGQRLANRVIADIGNLAQALEQAESL